MADDAPSPIIVLVQPQLGENIGMCCRAMLNAGLDRLHLVSPRDGWPNPKAVPTASGADKVVEQARVFDGTGDALENVRRVYATTARTRDSTKHVLSPREAATQMRHDEARGIASAILFGGESSGLTNDDVLLSDTIISIPVNPNFKSLNLAQAVFCVAYEWYVAGMGADHRHQDRTSNPIPATHQDRQHLFDHLESALDESGFLWPPERRPSMVRNLRTLFQRALLSEQEVRTLRGVITSLSRHRRDLREH